MRFLTLLIRRLLVFAIGAVTIWLIVFVFFDFADQWFPAVLALSMTYALAAYVIIPRAIHMGLKVLSRGRVPSFTTTGDGFPGDPVNIGLIGKLEDLERAFATAGWVQPDSLSLASSWRMACAFVLNRPYPTAPFSTLFLFGRGQDVGFQRAIGNSPRKRHHVRFWGVSVALVLEEKGDPAFWNVGERPAADDSQVLWLGAGTRDTGLSLTHMSFQITHATDRNTDAERDLVILDLQQVSAIQNVREVMPGERLNIGKINRYLTDGRVTIAELRDVSEV
jgi:hypothetical protein